MTTEPTIQRKPKIASLGGHMNESQQMSTTTPIEELIKRARESRAEQGLPTPPDDPFLADRLVAILDRAEQRKAPK